MSDYSRAACRGEEPELFFPIHPNGNSTPEERRDYRVQTAEALAVCGRCPVRAQCLEDHLMETEGIFGGMTPFGRTTYRRQRGIFKDRLATNALSFDYSMRPDAVRRRQERARRREKAAQA